MTFETKGIVFDLDQTLVNSNCVAKYRDARNWVVVKQKLGEISAFEGIKDLIFDLHLNKIVTVVVTSSPSWYCNSILSQNKLQFDKPPVCYHDTLRKKPHPDPILEALNRLNIEPKNALAIGDDRKDTIAAKNAGVFSVGSAWGCSDLEELEKSLPNKICYSVKELREFIFCKL
jgi:HAD superfamily hydrolase (TIGR01662 family)